MARERQRQNQARSMIRSLGSRPSFGEPNPPSLDTGLDIRDGSSLDGIILPTGSLIHQVSWIIETASQSETMTKLMEAMSRMAKMVASDRISATIVEFDIGGTFRTRDDKQSLNLKLKEPRVRELRDFGVLIFPVTFGDLIYLNKYEYLIGGTGNIDWWNLMDNPMGRVGNLLSKLGDLDQYIEFSFLKDAGQYIWVQLQQDFQQGSNS